MTSASLRKVLIVDDDRDCADELAELLECYGCTMFTAADRQQAEAVRLEHRPDIVVLDLGLGADSGLELALDWQRLDGPRPMVILASGRQLIPAEIARFGGNVPPLMMKPIDAGKMLALFGQG